MDENSLNASFTTSKVVKNKLTSKNPKYGTPGFLFYKNTSNYTRVVAEPGSLSSTPRIFKINQFKKNNRNASDSLTVNLLSLDSFNPNKNERFCHVAINYKRNKITKKNKKEVVKAKEKTVKKYIKVEKCIRSEEKKEVMKQEPKKAVKIQKALTYEDKSSTNDISENKMNKVDIYNVPEKETIIFHMHHPSKFSFNGELRITIVTGEVEVLGYTLSSSSTTSSVNLYSPNFCTPLVVQSKLPKENRPIEELLGKLKDNMTESDYCKIYGKLKPEDSVLFVEQIKSNFGIVINKYIDVSVFSQDLEDVFLMTDTFKNLPSIFTFKFLRDGKYFRKNRLWDKIPLGQCTILCGGKGVGKSTLLKYYVNKFISLEEKVLCLDFDPGQPEFSFPGSLTAVIVDQPLLGPNFTHVKEPVLMLNYGDVDVSQNPAKYLECVKYIIEYCRKNEELLKMKWFVNTMGFCKGLGVSLMITILKLLKPNTVIQIKCSDYKNNYPFYLTPVTLNSMPGFWSIVLDDVVLSYDLRVVHSCAERRKKQLYGGLKPRQLRDIMSISYFSKAVTSPFYNFNAVQPYLISFSELYLGIDFFINLNDVLKAFNGSIVSLSYFEPDVEEIFSVGSEVDVYFKVVIKPKVAPSFGIGLVRGIDCQERRFYLMTHLSIETLSRVNCLTLGQVSAPHSMFLKQEGVEGRTVYTTSGTIDTIHRVRRIFRMPGTHYKESQRNVT